MNRRLGLRYGGLLALALALTLAAVRPPAASAQSAAPAGRLDGRNFSVATGPAGRRSADKDVLIFKDGSFRSTAGDPYGFEAATYSTLARPDGSLGFAATTVSPKEGTIRWQGTVRGDAVSGSYVWTKAGRPAASYWFRGARQPS